MQPSSDATADVLLNDGTIAVVRMARPSDRPDLEALDDGVSDVSFRLRFFSAGRRSGRRYVDHPFSEDAPEVTLVALVADRVVAVATAERVDAVAAEVAFLVADDFRRHGVGVLLLEHLAAAGRERGISRFTAEVLSENRAVLGVFRAAGFEVERESSGGVVDVAMSTAASTRALETAVLARAPPKRDRSPVCCGRTAWPSSG